MVYAVMKARLVMTSELLLTLIIIEQPFKFCQRMMSAFEVAFSLHPSERRFFLGHQ